MPGMFQSVGSQRIGHDLGTEKPPPVVKTSPSNGVGVGSISDRAAKIPHAKQKTEAIL